MKTPNSSNKFMIFILLYAFLLPEILVTITRPFMLSFMSISCYALILNAIASFIEFALPIIIYMRVIRKEPILSVIPHKKTSLKNIPVLIAIAIFLEPVSNFIVAIFSLFLKNNVTTYLSDINSLPFWLKTVCIAVVPAIFEELMFRGFLLNGLKRAKLWKIALVSGLFFGLMHMDLHQLTYAFPLGAYFAVLVYYSGSIFSSMILHFIINFSSLAVASLTYIGEGAVPEASFSETLSTVMCFFPFAAVSAVILFFLTKYFIKINKQNSMAESINNENNNTYNYVTGENLYYGTTFDTLQQQPVFTRYFYIVIALYIVIMFINSILYY